MVGPLGLALVCCAMMVLDRILISSDTIVASANAVTHSESSNGE